MKTNVALRLFWFAGVALLFAGCVTHRIDWNARVGNYTFDQAVTEFGPPDRQAKLSDGQLVTEWITRYNNGGTIFVGGGLYGRPGSVGFLQSTGPGCYESKLLLTFSTNNLLTAWAKK
jgi:hypothetical protein